MARSPGVDFDAASPSAAAELAWLLDLLVQAAPYAEPALDELDRSLLPGVAALRPHVRDRFTALWTDTLAGCPELLVSAGEGDCLADQEPRRLVTWLTTLPPAPQPQCSLDLEPAVTRRLIRRRLSLLDADVKVRRGYRDLLSEVWDLAGPVWKRRGRAVAAAASADWNRRLEGVRTASGMLRLMPPRHPLTRSGGERAAALMRRRRVRLIPIYFCMSGGLLADLGDRMLVGVPASAHEPIRRRRDASFVADRLRILGESTRVHILIHLMSTWSGVMEIARALEMSQPTVSEHVRVLRAAGLLRARRRRGRTVYAASGRGVDRLLEDAGATLARWE